ncbi:MAG: phosphate acetyltransferase [Opitutales bacterium]|nr:phosphate acetyltransferase [Opitutales bacterium]MCH8540669.1 phosphate acetyltransferase [Opitutales bacterium]
MSLIDRLTAKLQRHPKRIVFPEGSDPRILQAARQFKTRRMGVPILVGDRSVIKDRAAKLDIDLTGIRLIEPERSESFTDFVRNLDNVRRYKGMHVEEATEAMKNPSIFATMMLATAQADAIVSGATASASSALRPLFRIIPRQEGVETASSMLILDLENKDLGLDGVLFLADCGVLPDPTAEQLADIAVTTARIAHHLTNEIPRVAMLGFSTKAKTAKHPAIAKMQSATALARQKIRYSGDQFEIDGEMQVDAALDRRTAEIKEVGGFVAGRANVLIFPDLNSGNIAAKLVQTISGANAYGQIITGLQKPAAEVSRGMSAHDVFGAATIAGCQAIDMRLLYGNLN